MARPPLSLGSPAPLARWWSAKPARERRVLGAIALVVGAALLWLALWQPLVRDIATLRATQARNGVALADARRLSGEIAGLARASAPAAGDPRADFERILTQQGTRVALTQQDWKDGRGTLVFGAVSFDALVATLEALQRDARLRVTDATIAARVEPGTVRAELVLAR